MEEINVNKKTGQVEMDFELEAKKRDEIAKKYDVPITMLTLHGDEWRIFFPGKKLLTLEEYEKLGEHEKIAAKEENLRLFRK